MTTQCKISRVALIIMTCVSSAFANNAPLPDGILSLALIIPVVLVAWNFARVSLPENSRWKRVGVALGLTLCVLLAAAGTEVAALAMLGFLIYGTARGTQIIRFGMRRGSTLIGVVVCVTTLFGLANYLVSIYRSDDHSTLRFESQAVSRLRTLGKAATAYAQTDAARFASGFEDLQNAGMISPTFLAEADANAYRFKYFLKDRAAGFVIVAVPVSYGGIRHESCGLDMIPGSSLFKYLTHTRPVRSAIRSFSIDETGVVRATDLHRAQSPTRDDAGSWNPL